MQHYQDWTQSPWFPIMAAGLGMMASPSHFPLQAIGQGGLQGIKAAEEVAARGVHQQQLENEAAYRETTLAQGQQRLGLEQAQHGEAARYHNIEAAHQAAQLAAEQEHWRRQMDAEDHRFDIEMIRADTALKQQQAYQRHQENADAITAGYRTYLMTRPVSWTDPKTGQSGSASFNPDKGGFDIPEGAVVGRVPVSTEAQKDAEVTRMENSAREDWKATHPFGLAQGETAPDFRGIAEARYANRHPPAGAAQTGAQPAASAAPAAPAAGGTPQQPQLTPEAISRLHEGKITTFNNGTRWTLRNGSPVQVQ
jgi:hypothetical protein